MLQFEQWRDMRTHARARASRCTQWTALALLDTTDKAVRGTTGEQCRDM